jgi:4-aminobutyrate aminotransferase
MREDKRVEDVIRRDKKIFLRTTRGDTRFVVSRGDGDFAYDIAGKRYIDFSSFVSVYNLGINANEEIRTAVKEQVDTLMHPGFTEFYSELPVIFGELLLKLMPKGFGRMFLSNSGTEANEAAIKYANIFTKRHYNISFYGAFHGRTKGSLGLTASKFIQRQYFGPFSNTIHVPFAYCYRCPLKLEYPSCGIACVDYIEEYPLRKEVGPAEVSAFFVEPIQGEGGYIVPPKDYFKRIEKIAKKNGMLLVSDEVQAGYMRTGKFLGMENFGVTADIYTMAKSVGAGLPMGVTVTKSSLGDIKEGEHANTFGGNLAAVAGATASLRYLIKNKSRLEREVLVKGEFIMKRLNEFKERYEIVGDVRGIGMMTALELVKDRRSKAPAVEERSKIIMDAERNGLILLPAGESTIRIIPPLTIKQQVLEDGLDLLEESIKKFSSNH